MLERVSANDLVFYRFAALSGIRHGVFTRLGGVSAPPFASLNVGGSIGDDPLSVRGNHERMYSALGVDGARACSVWQVHSADVIVATEPANDRSWIAQADAMITDRPETPLSMRFADCVPILFAAPAHGVIGIAHAGWRGTVARVASATVRAMSDTYGVPADAVTAVIGPSISGTVYQVGTEVVAAIRAAYGVGDDDPNAPADERLLRRDPADGSAYLDLWAANRLDLLRAGVETILVSGICTAQNTHEFFSHRAEAGRTGRFGAVISL